MDAPFVKPVKTHKDKSDRATKDRVLDSKTLIILEKLQKRNILFDLEGCISSGKEANIYKAKIRRTPKCKFIKRSDTETEIHDDIADAGRTDDTVTKDSVLLPISGEENVAIKIFRTSILEFRNRNVYITNEIRFKNFRVSNPRKLIKTWAEKEVRNLKRLNNSNIPAPQPLYLKRNIIIMKLIGSETHIAAKLKDLQNVDFVEIYREVIDLIARMYRDAKLIHCDLSEYNLLYYDSKVYVIDVGQSVDVTHVYADVFLVNDIANVSKFFERKGIEVESIRSVYEHVTGKEMHFDIKGCEINKLGFDTGRLLELCDGHKTSMCAKPLYDKNKANSTQKDVHPRNDGQFTKNGILTKEEKLERRRRFKDERKMKRMSRLKKNKEVKNVKRKKHVHKRIK